MGYGTADLDKIDIVGPGVETVATSFKPHETAELQFQWQEASPAEYLAAD
jgi:hypothetical protein